VANAATRGDELIAGLKGLMDADDESVTSGAAV